MPIYFNFPVWTWLHLVARQKNGRLVKFIDELVNGQGRDLQKGGAVVQDHTFQVFSQFSQFLHIWDCADETSD